MPLYEHILMGRQDISAQQFEALLETYKTIITDKGGSIEKTENWGIKNLAYKIKKNRKAHFALLNIDAPHEAVAEMERQMGISTDVIRFLTLRMDELDSDPSPMMKRGDRDDRRGGRRDSGPRPRFRDDRNAPRKDRDTAGKVEAPKKDASEDNSAGTGTPEPSKSEPSKSEPSKSDADKADAGKKEE